jgi:hypothetical protein
MKKEKINRKVNIPKKFKDILDLLRSGQIEIGLEQLEKIDGFEPQKAIVMAEINYFSEKHETAMTYDEYALHFDEQWYAGNILHEHFIAYTYAAMISNNITRAKKFYKKYLTEKEKSGLKEFQMDNYRFMIKRQLRRLDGKKINGKKTLKVIEEGKPKDTFIEQLKKYRPKFSYESADGAQYLLSFMFETANTKESLAYYEKYARGINYEDTHIDASRLFLAANKIAKAKKALMTFVTKSWCPVEILQITPMRVWEYDELYPLLTKNMKKKILYALKAK